MERKKALDLIGGYETFQDKIYGIVKERLETMDRSELEKIDNTLKDVGLLKDGLEDGIKELEHTKKYLTSPNIHLLESFLGFSKGDIMKFEIPKEDIPYWKSRQSQMVSSGPAVTLDFAVYLSMCGEIYKEGKRIYQKSDL